MKVFIFVLLLIPSLVFSNEKQPHYKTKNMVGPSYTLEKELSMRLQGVLNANNYVVKNMDGKIVSEFDDLIKKKNGSYSFYITAHQQEKLRLNVKIVRKSSGVHLRLHEASAKTKKKKRVVNLQIPRVKPSAKKVNRLMTRLNQFADLADQNLAFEVENLMPGAPPNHTEMGMLALFIALKTSKMSDSSIAYYNLLNYVFQRIDKAN